MTNLSCTDCPYYWYDYDDEGNAISTRPYCHWVSRCPGDIAPCEEDEYEDEYEIYEYEEYALEIPASEEAYE